MWEGIYWESVKLDPKKSYKVKELCRHMEALERELEAKSEALAAYKEENQRLGQELAQMALCRAATELLNKLQQCEYYSGNRSDRSSHNTDPIQNA